MSSADNNRRADVSIVRIDTFFGSMLLLFVTLLFPLIAVIVLPMCLLMLLLHQRIALKKRAAYAAFLRPSPFYF